MKRNSVWQFAHCFRGCLWLVLASFLFGMQQARATTVVPPSFTELVNKSEYIVRAAVKSVTCEWRDAGPHQHIITKVELEVKEVVAGQPPVHVVLEMLGGQVGDKQLIVDGMPQFRVGDEDVLFVRGNGKVFCPLVALLHGRYPIRSETASGREYVARGDGTPLSSETEVGRPLAESISNASPTASAGMTPAEFISKIKLARAP